MGGMGFIHSAECEIMRNSALINIHMINAAAEAGIERYFLSSSACVYRDMTFEEPELTEELPIRETGQRIRLGKALRREDGDGLRPEVRYGGPHCAVPEHDGPEGTWTGGREKAPAAICRKVCMASDGGEVEAWGDGKAMEPIPTLTT